jgi:hypothetical protein
VIADSLSSPDAMLKTVWHNPDQRKRYYTWGGTSCIVLCHLCFFVVFHVALIYIFLFLFLLVTVCLFCFDWSSCDCFIGYFLIVSWFFISFYILYLSNAPLIPFSSFFIPYFLFFLLLFFFWMVFDYPCYYFLFFVPECPKSRAHLETDI